MKVPTSEVSDRKHRVHTSQTLAIDVTDERLCDKQFTVHYMYVTTGGVVQL